MTPEHTFYSREGLLVEGYDSAQPELGDQDFYCSLAQETGGPVLELACGTGRVLWPLAEAGFDIQGLDRSEAMLRRAEGKRAAHSEEVSARARLQLGDMREFEFEERFGLIFIACRSFQALLTSDDQHTALRCAHRHLRPDGKLALHVFDPLLEWCVPGEVDLAAGRSQVEGEHPLPSGNQLEITILQRTNDPLLQRLTERWRLREVDSGGKVLREEEEVLEMRWIYRWEMHYLFERCGFHIEAEYGGFDRSPPAYGREQIWVATK